MESFFLAETTKYLYLLFDEDNFLHNDGEDRHGELLDTEDDVCIVQTGAYIFNTEAHPMDMSALHCCHNYKEDIYTQLDLQAFSAKGLFERSSKQRVSSQENWKPACHSGKGRFENDMLGESRSSDKESHSRDSPSTTMAVDIEVFDEYQQPAADVLVGNFERIREERELNRSMTSANTVARNQLTVSDLEDFYALKRESFTSAADTLSYVFSFMNNFTMDVAFIRGLQLFDVNISTVLGTGAQKEYEGRMRSLWQLYELEQQYGVNVRLIRRLGLLNFQGENNQLRHYTLLNIIDSLDTLENPSHPAVSEIITSHARTDSKLNYTDITLIHLAVFEALVEYEFSMLNTTAMQEFLHRVYLMGTTEATQTVQAMEPLLSPAELETLEVVELEPAEQRELFKYTRRIVDFRKRISETVDRLQTIMQDINAAKGETEPVMSTAPSPHRDDLVTARQQHEELQKPPPEKPPQQEKPQQEKQLLEQPDQGSVWSQFVQKILRKTIARRIKFDEAVLLEKTRKSLEKHAHKHLTYELFSCRRPEYIEAFSYRDFYPDAI